MKKIICILVVCALALPLLFAKNANNFIFAGQLFSFRGYERDEGIATFTYASEDATFIISQNTDEVVWDVETVVKQQGQKYFNGKYRRENCKRNDVIMQGFSASASGNPYLVMFRITPTDIITFMPFGEYADTVLSKQSQYRNALCQFEW